MRHIPLIAFVFAAAVAVLAARVAPVNHAALHAASPALAPSVAVMDSGGGCATAEECAAIVVGGPAPAAKRGS